MNLTTTGPPETVLEPEPDETLQALAAALEGPGDHHGVLSSVVADHPDSLAGWVELGSVARDDVEAYACYRVAYHRGLDRLRQSGWRGSGFVRWRHPTNQAFLRAVQGLARQAATIGEAGEADRCQQFLAQLDPDLAGADGSGSG